MLPRNWERCGITLLKKRALKKRAAKKKEKQGKDTAAYLVQ
jgi:hypothetical protein